MSREADMDETINARLFDCFGQATKEAFPRFRLLGSRDNKACSGVISLEPVPRCAIRRW